MIHDSKLTNYISYVCSVSHLHCVGSLVSESTIQPLSFASGTPLSNLYQVVILGNDDGAIIPSGEPISVSNVKVLPPFTGRDILAVGKNYSDHAKEFNKSGYDSSDKADQPTHPVIFTKRATSIIADGEDIYPHPGFTESLDYEGEIGVIIGKSGFRVSKEDAMGYVWGYTIINDMTARERQKDHKQFYIGKSPDTFCPMGPIAIPKEHLPDVLRVQTFVNGEKRQDGTTEDLIFSISQLVVTLSEGQTVQPGDVLATGTPAGVGIGMDPPSFLKSGDTIEVSVTGLGKLKNRIALVGAENPTVSRVKAETMEALNMTNASKPCIGIGLTRIGQKSLYYVKSGPNNSHPVVFVHGLGGSSESFVPLISSLNLNSSHSLHQFDLEGHGLSPTSPLSKLSVESFTEDLEGVFRYASISSGAIIVAHSTGCLIALAFAIQNPGLVSGLILLGPPTSLVTEEVGESLRAQAALVRERGTPAVVDAVVEANTSDATQKSNLVTLTAVRLSILSQDPEGYAKACSAFADAKKVLGLAKVQARTLIVTGSEDKVSPPYTCTKMKGEISKCKDLVILDMVGHWQIFEDPAGVSRAVGKFLSS